MKLKVFTVVDPNFSKLPKVKAVNALLKYHGYDYDYMIDYEWTGWGSKLKRFIEYIRDLDTSYTHVMLLDGSDVIPLAASDKVMARWENLGHPWVYGAERNRWPTDGIPEEDWPGPPCLFRYLNGGMCLGRREHMYKWCSKWTDGFTNIPTNESSDQLWMSKRYTENYPDAISLDHYCILFQNTHKAHHLLELSPGRVFNKVHGTDPLLIHYNGGRDITDPRWSILWRHWIGGNDELA